MPQKTSNWTRIVPKLSFLVPKASPMMSDLENKMRKVEQPVGVIVYFAFQIPHS